MSLAVRESRHAEPLEQFRSTVVDPIEDARWLELAQASGGGSIFHHPAWLRLLTATYRYPLAAHCVTAGDRLLAGLPVATVASRLTGRRLVALPFSDLCPPLVRGDAPQDASPALALALRQVAAREGCSFEVRGAGAVLEDAAPGERFHHHLLRLGVDVSAVERRFAKAQVKRGVRRALRDGLRVELRTDAPAIADFYRLHLGTRRRLGLPTQPRRFIAGLAGVFDEGLGFIALVRSSELPVAAAVFLTFGSTLTYKYGASDQAWLRSRPNNLLFMEAIRWGCEHGYERLDFGRTHWGQEGLRSFKLAWGAEERELRYRQVAGKSHEVGSSGLGASARRGLATVIRRSPPLTSRIAGELFYRHAG
jgi:CelD/BcsL family acetyltransferase involved in cellulose biosynthesis